ncbi:RMD1 family protein [Ekhidna sp.]|uniref:RMD1 family protein n=1 Tax=Ekhidna sp. TaxID=2608089 RepID=UPI003B5CD054
MMEKKGFTYSAYLLADKIDLASFRKDHTDHLKSSNSSELYYQTSEDKFMYLLSYGVVVFANMKSADIQLFLGRISPYCINLKEKPVEDDLQVEFLSDSQIQIGFAELKIGRFDHPVNRMVMLHLAQSVALDHYSILMEQILRSINTHTDLMRVKGRILLSKRKALRFIGTALSTKNTIAENLYILDSPEIAWEDEFLDQLHRKLVNHFELAQRYRALENTLKIVGDNLEVYISYNNHRESSRLEWIIIILIVIEVVDTLLSKFI